MLVPAAPSGLLTGDVHFEKWGCAKAFGKEIVKRLVAGEGRVVVKLTPQVEEGVGVRLGAEVVSVDADGALGEMLRSGPLGEALKEKVRNSLVSALGKSTDFMASLPPAVREVAAIRRADFADGGGGRLLLAIWGEAHIPLAESKPLLDRLKSELR